jgi:hypothetical protein|tara:strand:- start:556 stop:663 length:108 start_codon:yes stop_codon:yes gene_type:complete
MNKQKKGTALEAGAGEWSILGVSLVVLGSKFELAA